VKTQDSAARYVKDDRDPRTTYPKAIDLIDGPMVGLQDPECSSGLRNVGAVSPFIKLSAICPATAQYESASDRVTGHRLHHTSDP
jgi:hypothetical protein